MVRTWTGNDQNNYKAATPTWGFLWDSWDMDGRGGNDTLIGGPKNDTLNGNTGIDEMRGGLGDDTYHVDSAFDQVIEYANQGTDKVISSIDYTLGDYLENLTLEGSALKGVGNSLNNVIHGNDLKNEIRGGGGHDSLYGHWGHDNMRGEVGDDYVHGGEGNDYLHGDGGNDTLIGAKHDDTLLGDSGNDSLSGGDGKDVLYGDAVGLSNGTGTGKGQIDTLTGGADGDIFVLGSRQSNQAFYNDGNIFTSGLSDYALITDFTVGVDTIHIKGSLSNYILGSSPISGISGTAIYLDQPLGQPNELIAIVQNVNPTSLNSSSNFYELT